MSIRMFSRRPWGVLALGGYLLLLAGLSTGPAVRAVAAGPSAAGSPTFTQPAPSPTRTPSPWPSPTPTVSPLPSPSPTPTPTAQPSPTPTPTPTALPSPTPTASPAPPPQVFISEVAWAGTGASSADEWLELYNPNPFPVDLNGWHLEAADGTPHIALQGTIGAGGFFLLERTDDSTVSDVPADQIYTGALSNGGEVLYLRAPDGTVVDTVNGDGGPWPAGGTARRASMERHTWGAEQDGAWHTAVVSAGHDANGQPLWGTPRQANGPAATPTPTPTAQPSPTPTASPTPPPQVFISEVAWAGTGASSADEWLELYNPNPFPVDLNGWHLEAADGTPHIALQGTIGAGGFFLLERTDDSTVSDVPADQIYTGALSNGGEVLYLRAPDGTVVDTANGDGGPWPAGGTARRASMERHTWGAEQDGAWHTAVVSAGHDANGQPLWGTPRQANGPAATPTPTPTARPSPTPTASPTPPPDLPPAAAYVRLNEFLPHPRYDWNGDGEINSRDEFIEIINWGPVGVDLSGWYLDDGPGGSPPYRLPEVGLNPGGRKVFFASQTGLRLADRGDMVRLLDPWGRVVDAFAYVDASSWNLTWCRLAALDRAWAYPCWPTPGNRNVPYGAPRAAYRAPGAEPPREPLLAAHGVLSPGGSWRRLGWGAWPRPPWRY